MPKVTLAPLGVNAAFVSDHQRADPPSRRVITGWTESAARRNRQFLQTVDPLALRHDLGVAFTLTLKDCPPSAEEFARLRDMFCKRLVRMGAIRFHWVTEWQKRGVPHLHGFVFFDRAFFSSIAPPSTVKRFPVPTDLASREEWDVFAVDLWRRCIKRAWVEIASAYSAGLQSQHAMHIDVIAGWVLYLSKHAARGADHYQREKAKLPEGWQSSGRLWGKGGDWPTRSEEFECDEGTFHRYRRLLRRWGISKAKAQLRAGRRHGNRVQISTAQSRLRFYARSGHSTAETATEKARWASVKGYSVSLAYPHSQYALEWALESDGAFLRPWVPFKDRSGAGDRKTAPESLPGQPIGQ